METPPIESSDRLYPARPILAVSAAVFRDGDVLLARRAREPMAGRYSLPGGVVEVGETLAEAVRREVMEEVGIEAEIVAFNRHVEPMVREGPRVRSHFVVASFVARWVGGEPHLSPEVDAVTWVEPGGWRALLTTVGLAEVLESAVRIGSGL